MTDRLGGLDGLRYEQRDGIAIVTLDRAAVGNSLSRAMRPQLERVWAEVRDNPSVRAVVITGAGERHFCTGADVSEVNATGGTSSGHGRAEEVIAWSPLQHRVWKPVVCAVNGTVAGGGLHFVADADVVVAARHASFLDTHVSVGQVGAVENIGLLARMPLGAVLRMTLSGRRFRLSAERAHALGLVDELTESADLLDVAIGIATDMASNSPTAVARSKQALWNVVETTTRPAVEYGWALAQLQWSHPDFREGAAAFVEKRDPEWTVEDDQ